MFDLLSLLTSDSIDQAVGNHVLKTIDNGLNCNWGLLSFRHLKIKYKKHSSLLCVSDFSFVCQDISVSLKLNKPWLTIVCYWYNK